MNAAMKGMLNLMGKFLAMGLSLVDVIMDSTSNPAREIKLDALGHLSVGSPADVAVLRLEKGSFGFVDFSRRPPPGVNGSSVRSPCATARSCTTERHDRRSLGFAARHARGGDPKWDRTRAPLRSERLRLAKCEAYGRADLRPAAHRVRLTAAVRPTLRRCGTPRASGT